MIREDKVSSYILSVKHTSPSTCCRPPAPLAGEPVFLQAAVGLFRDGHFNQAAGQGWFEVAFPEGFTVCRA
ncbi:MAG: hypothetical protein A2097_16000 [Desulfobacula sp. GWF2_41_7]|nr:MAG: hypothetical protein A2097_16000 [Desulfobacula sp. GWF2_41_7]